MKTAASISVETARAIPDGTGQLRALVSKVRNRWLAFSAGRGFSWIVLFIIPAATIEFVLDWWLEMPLEARTLWLGLEMAAVAWLLLRFAIRPWLKRPDDDTVALWIEKAQPDFRTRLIASLQLSRPGALAPGDSQALVRALVADTCRLAEQQQPAAIIPSRPLATLAGYAAIVLGVATCVFWMTREASVPLLKRAFLLPVEVPRKTHVELVRAGQLVGRGDSVTITAMARGIVPNHGSLLIKHPTGRTEQFTILPDKKQPRKFERTLDNVQNSFSARVRLNDGLSEWFEIRVEPRPELAFLECYQEYPPYTGLGKIKRALGDLAILAGSRLHIQVTASKDVASASVQLAGLNRSEPLSVSRENPKKLSGSIEIRDPKLTGIAFSLTDKFGINSKDSALYRVDVLPDQPPTVRITYPERREELVTQQAIMLVAFEAADDFGLNKVFLRYKVDTVDQGAEKSIELELDGQRPRSMRRRFEWRIRDLTPLPPEGSLIEYWIVAEDANNLTGPGRGATEHFVARVVSEAEKRADLMNRVNDYLTGLTEVIQDQEKLNQTLGTLIREKVP